MSLEKKGLRPIFYDTETSGLVASADRIIEIAAYDPLTNSSFCSLVNPLMPIPKESTEISHITDAMVKDSPTFAEVGKEFIKFCPPDAVLIAHNNDGFDKFFLQAEFTRNQIAMPVWKYIDTLKWARKYRSDLPKHSLQYLREIYGVAANTAHRAMDDVMVLFTVFSKMIDDLDYTTVYEMLYKPKALNQQYMPFGKYQGKPLTEVPKSYLSWLMKNSVFDKPENEELKKAFTNLGLLEGIGL